jgi:hypothetical protein
MFTETFTARHVAEPLPSFDANADARDVQNFMHTHGLNVVGIRKAGRVAGYVERGSLEEGICGAYLRPLESATIVEDTAPLLNVLSAIAGARYLLVLMLGEVGGIITPADMQKAPVRMWLFGMVTLIEMRFAQLIELHSSAESWKQYLSAGRLQKAQDLLSERSRRNRPSGGQEPAAGRPLRLLDCLQFADKGQIVARNEELRKLTVFSSRRQAEQSTRRLEQLRNNLAHAQEIPAADWEIIVQLCELLSR